MGLGDSTGFPGWVLIVLIVFAVVWVCTVAFLLYRRRRIYNRAVDQARAGVVVCMGDDELEALESSALPDPVIATTSRNSLPDNVGGPSTSTVATQVYQSPESSGAVPTLLGRTTAVVVVNDVHSESTVARSLANPIAARPISFPSADPVSHRYVGRIQPAKILKREAKRRAADRATLQSTGVVPPPDVERGGAAPTRLNSDSIYAMALLNSYQGGAVSVGTLVTDLPVADEDTETTVRNSGGERDCSTAARVARTARPTAYPHQHLCSHNLEEERVNGELPTFHACGEGCVYFYTRPAHTTAESCSSPQPH